MMILPASGDYAMLVVFAVSFGFFGGAYAGLFPVVMVVLYGVSNLPRALSMAMTAWAVGGIFGSPISGMIFDATGSYTIAWLGCGLSWVIGGALMFMTPVVDRWYPDRCKAPSPQERVVLQQGLLGGKPKQPAATAAPGPPSTPPGAPADATEDEPRPGTGANGVAGGGAALAAGGIPASLKPTAGFPAEEESAGRLVVAETVFQFTQAQLSGAKTLLAQKEAENQALASRVAALESRLKASEEQELAVSSRLRSVEQSRGDLTREAQAALAATAATRAQMREAGKCCVFPCA